MARTAPARRTAPEKATPRGTKDRLVDLATDVFAHEGYAAASVRDLARRSGLTSGAIYANFRNKADLLAEAVDTRMTADWQRLPPRVNTDSPSEASVFHFKNYRKRGALRALLLEGAVAARTDAEVRQRLHETFANFNDRSAKAFERAAEDEGFRADLDMRALVTLLVSADLGLAVFEALDLPLPDPRSWEDLANQIFESLRRQPATRAPAKKRARTARPTTKR